MPRIARVVAVDYPHHITQRGNNKAVVFFDDEDRLYYCETLTKFSKKYQLEIWAYCLMGNHIHLLAVPRKTDSLAKGIGLTNLVYTQYLNRKLNNSGRVWQNRFFSCLINRDEYLWAVARYIEMNPVKAGLVNNPGEYFWSSAQPHLDGRKDEILSKEEWLMPDDRQRYSEFILQSAEEIEKAIRRNTSTGKPLANEEFLASMKEKIGVRLTKDEIGRPRKNREVSP